MAKSVLIVDDDLDLCYGLMEIISEAGHLAQSANDTDSALDMLGKNTYDVVLLDIKMPGISGIDLLKRVRDNPVAGKIYVLSGAPDARLKLEEAGVLGLTSGIVTKPFDIDGLLAVIAKDI